MTLEDYIAGLIDNLRPGRRGEVTFVVEDVGGTYTASVLYVDDVFTSDGTPGERFVSQGAVKKE